MDPQQRLLLELSWEALEDAGLPPSSLAGTETGVFVGASTVDYGNSKLFDHAATDGYFATGNAASILANRISYIYDLNGPSFTVDTACSSSLVALDAAVQALQSGRIETAIVGGVSILTAPFQFVSFSQASMLSRTGLCQAFSSKADGYVRSEGGAVLILRAQGRSTAAAERVHARIVATRVNSDGRTNGIALPSKKRQAQLLGQIYGDAGLDARHLAFVEAHGTGTPVGDPIEATALGETLGPLRAEPLPIGSIKSNIGHTEAAAGVAGLLKAMLALEHDLLPASLHCDEPNPNIDFERLNLRVASTAVPLTRSKAPRLAGVSSYGFGGTNAHVVLTDARPVRSRPARTAPSILMLSAHTRQALSDLASAYADRLETVEEPIEPLVASANHGREILPERLIVTSTNAADVAASLRSFVEKGPDSTEAIVGTAVARSAGVAFVYSGNGSQWVGMGCAAYRANPVFRASLDEVDGLFQQLSGWSLVAMMNSDGLVDQLGKTSVAQPLIFAIQAATTRALKHLGLVPGVVLGHSVGEVAAAEAAGILDLLTAVKVIYYRSLHQELVSGKGSMAVLIGTQEAAQKLAAEIPGLSIAAYNSPRATTLSGTAASLDALAGATKALRARVQKLDIAYPFHSSLIAAIEKPLRADLGVLNTREGTATFVSTVTGSALEGHHLDGGYWWRNVREPVLFAQAVEDAARLGARIFVEIGPSPILMSHINDTLGSVDSAIAVLSVLDRKDTDRDPFTHAVASALSRGAQVEREVLFGSNPGPSAHAPAYPWQKKPYRLAETVESSAILTPRPWHPLVGARYALDQLEWHSLLDTSLVPALADHVVDGHVLLPGAAFAEMALAVARDWLGSETAAVADLEIHQPMILAGAASREVRCRIQPVTATLEIMSRPRLAQAAWQVHATAKILRFAASAEPPPSWPEAAGVPDITGAELYPAAAASGLQYGPAYRLLDKAYRIGPNGIVVDLVRGDTDPRYGFDPAHVDACFHGLVLLFAELAVKGRLKPYVPVGVSDLKLFRPGVSVTRAYIEIARSDERTIVAHFTLVDAEGRPVASLHGTRFQAMNAFRSSDRVIEFIAQKALLAAEPLAIQEEPSISAAQVVEAALSTGRLSQFGIAPSPDYILMEGWATATAFGLFEVLADNGIVDLDGLVASGRVAENLQPWCVRLLAALDQSGLVSKSEAGHYTIPTGADLPDPRDIIRALASEHPERSAELLLAARSSAIVDAIAAGCFEDSTPFTITALDAYDYGGHAAVASADLIADVLGRLEDVWTNDRAMRILLVGDGPLSALAAQLAAAKDAELTILEPDRRRLERVKLALDNRERVAFQGSFEQLPAASFDLVIASQSLHRVAADPARWASLAEAMAPGAVLLAVEPETAVFRDLVFGLQAGVKPPDHGTSNPSSVASEAAWLRAMRDVDLVGASVYRTTGTDFGLLCVGQKSDERINRTVKGDALVIGCDQPIGEAATALATMLKFSGIKVSSALDIDLDGTLPQEVPDTIVFMVQEAGSLPSAEHIARRCLRLRQVAMLIGTKKATLWIVCPGATRAGPDKAYSIESAIWAFARSLANEAPTLQIRLVDLTPGLTADIAARRLRDVVLSDTAETEIIVDASGTRVVRFERFEIKEPSAFGPDETVLRLVKGEHSGLDRMTWAAEGRRAPDPAEVEIAVEAAGLNFRDVMWGLSILPEEILEDGYAGATLGLECAGTIVRVGPGVDRFKVGDKVLAFAKAALATHVTVNTSVVASIPQGMSTMAAATVPVAFLTAYYALIRCARLEEDEWVLIHGGAGGVGLAAVQIARWRGARIVATAGSTERRDLLTTLGAEHVFDSRSNQFVDDIRRVTKTGVDVVLNSLAGEAMERSIAVLKPFGRFVELGKRDYVANTHIGLKPFRRNLSYFGVDLDQLILKGESIGQDLFGDVMGLFAEGAFSALPYRVFQARDVVDAFRVMQRSGHIGKIVILPPALPAKSATPIQPFIVAPDRTHMITGGLGGFGLETARWLIDRGARHLLLLGRTGASSVEARAALDAFRDANVQVEVANLDITDEEALASVLARTALSMPPLGGVIHAATVFDDAIIANLTRAKLESVLQAKVSGAEILDRQTRAFQLDYFILYSSATTLIGNPGQGAYVAANAFLEGLARRRRHLGLPGFAVAWGAIEDVGILARSGSATTSLLARSGVQGMVARQALDRLAEVLPHTEALPDPSVLAIAAVNWSAAREHLPVLRSKAFAELMHGVQASDSSGKSKIGVRALVEQEGIERATKKIAEAVQEEIARILRLPREDVSRNKALMEIGLDSLMAVELGMGLEERFALEAPLSTSAGTMTVNELADYVVSLSTRDATAEDQTSENLAFRHLDADLRKEVVDALPGLSGGASPSRKEIVS